MACHHKFEQELKLEKIDYAPLTLIVGTFNPGPPIPNPAKWFYDLPVTNYFWDVLPRLYGSPSLASATPEEWRQCCAENKIAITDLISSIDDVDQDNPQHIKAFAGFSDKALEYNFDGFNYTNIVQLLQKHPSIKNVYFTHGITDAFWRYLWNPVMHYCHKNQLHERRLITPSDEIKYQHEAYNTNNPENKITLIEDYILMRWREEWNF